MSNNSALDRQDVVDMLVREQGAVPEEVKFTCDKCHTLFSCNWAFDPYNQGGDCIAEK